MLLAVGEVRKRAGDHRRGVKETAGVREAAEVGDQGRQVLVVGQAAEAVVVGAAVVAADGEVFYSRSLESSYVARTAQNSL